MEELKEKKRWKRMWIEFSRDTQINRKRERGDLKEYRCKKCILNNTL